MATKSPRSSKAPARRTPDPDVDLVSVRRRAVDTVTGISPDDTGEHHANAAHRGGAVVDVAGTTMNRPERRALTRNGPAPIDHPAPRRRRSASTPKRVSKPARTAKAKTAKAKKRPAPKTTHKARAASKKSRPR